jgi:hypothetical protein
MKKFIIIILAVGIFSCGNGKETAVSTDAVEVTKDMVNGTIKDMTKTEGCDFVVEVIIDGETTLLEPLSMDAMYKVDGKTVKLIYTPSRRASKCMGTMPITIQKITE